MLRTILPSKKVLFSLGLVIILAGVGWWERTPLLSWYYLRELAQAEEEDRDKWVERVAGLDQAAVPGLLAHLRRDDARVCANARAALACLIQRWGSDDARAAALAEQLVQGYAGRSLPGQLETLELQAALAIPAKTNTPPPAGILLAAGRLLPVAAQTAHRGIQARALALADLVVDYHPAPDVMRAIHDLARAGLIAPDSTSRVRAVRLIRSRPLNGEKDLLELVLPLLRDPSAEVRRQAICAVALKDKESLISSEDLLAWLHDPDKEVRRWCEKALQVRDLSRVEIQLGRLITDERAKERMKVFRYLRRAPTKAPGAWILRLSYDAEDAVRIAAARAAGDHGLTNLADRLREMAQNDRSPTVRQVAEHYYRLTYRDK
jgi:hypothetical protein